MSAGFWLIVILYFIAIFSFVFYSGCTSIFTDISPDDSEYSQPANDNPNHNPDWIMIENDLETTKDCTPVLTIFSENAAYMSFSGDGNNWTEWIPYHSSYTEFNIASGLYGTIFGSGEKHVYVRFKDVEGNLSLLDELIFDSIDYKMQDLYFIKIVPQSVTISISDSFTFNAHAYDFGGKNEVPMEGSKVTWTKCCGVGKLSPTSGLSTTYTPPPIVGERNITVHYENLSTGAIISIIQ